VKQLKLAETIFQKRLRNDFRSDLGSPGDHSGILEVEPRPK
jgi:hypothetical protein